MAPASSGGVEHSDGSSAEWTGRKSTAAADDTVTRAYTIRAGPSTNTAQPARAMVTDRAKETATSTFSRGHRSAYCVASGATMAAGSTRTRATTPTSVAPPRPYA